MGIANININSERALTQSPSTNRAEALQLTKAEPLYGFRGSQIPGCEKLDLIASSSCSLFLVR